MPWTKVALGMGVAAGIGVLIYTQVDIHELHEKADRMPAGLAFGLLAVLPLIGFPASLLHIAAGIRFGAPIGFGLVVASILLQLLASYGIVTLWRSKFESARWVEKIRKRLPKGAHASICIFAVLLPGAPYSAINYVLPLMGVRLRTYLLCCLPVHSLRSSVTVLLGDQSDRLTPGRLAALVGYALLILAASWWMFRRMRKQFEDPPPAAGDPKPLA